MSRSARSRRLSPQLPRHDSPDRLVRMSPHPKSPHREHDAPRQRFPHNNQFSIDFPMETPLLSKPLLSELIASVDLSKHESFSRTVLVIPAHEFDKVSELFKDYRDVIVLRSERIPIEHKQG